MRSATKILPPVAKSHGGNMTLVSWSSGRHRPERDPPLRDFVTHDATKDAAKDAPASDPPTTGESEPPTGLEITATATPTTMPVTTPSATATISTCLIVNPFASLFAWRSVAHPQACGMGLNENARTLGNPRKLS
jgi:hypothetical protein